MPLIRAVYGIGLRQKLRILGQPHIFVFVFFPEVLEFFLIRLPDHGVKKIKRGAPEDKNQKLRFTFY